MLLRLPFELLNVIFAFIAFKEEYIFNFLEIENESKISNFSNQKSKSWFSIDAVGLFCWLRVCKTMKAVAIFSVDFLLHSNTFHSGDKTILSLAYLPSIKEDACDFPMKNSAEDFSSVKFCNAFSCGSSSNHFRLSLLASIRKLDCLLESEIAFDSIIVPASPIGELCSSVTSYSWHNVRCNSLSVICSGYFPTFCDFEPGVTPHLQWVAEIASVFAPLVKELVLSSDFNHCGLSVYVFDDTGSLWLSQNAPMVNIVFCHCCLHSQTFCDADAVFSPLLDCLFEYLLNFSHGSVVLNDCWVSRSSLLSGDPDYQLYLSDGGNLLWTAWHAARDDEGKWSPTDRISFFSLLRPDELVRLLSSGVTVLPSEWQTSPL